MTPHDPLTDPDRLAAVAELGLDGAPQQPLLARLNRLAQQLLGVPVSIVSIVTGERQVHASQLGLFADVTGPSELPMTHSFCKTIARTGEPLIVADARRHPLVKDSPSIQDYAVIAYAGFPLRLEDGEVVGAFCAIDHEPREWTPEELEIVNDLTELATALLDQRRSIRLAQLQTLNEELMRSNEEYDAFAHAAAHDLKAPLRGIRQFVDFHVEDTAGRLSEEEAGQLTTVTRLTDRMNGLLDGLMAYAQAGGTASRPRPIGLGEAADDVVGLLGLRPGEVTVADEDATVTTDPATLRQILLNLVGNAAKYSDGPPAVRIDLTTLEALGEQPSIPVNIAVLPPETRVLTVADQGIGIHPDHHDRVFRLFHQLDPESDGTGTGLAMCRRICRRRGGDLWLTSALGEGTTFYVVIA